MKDLLAVSAILMPFVFKIIQVLRDKKKQLKEVNDISNSGNLSH
jgi:hypothetical protein